MFGQFNNMFKTLISTFGEDTVTFSRKNQAWSQHALPNKTWATKALFDSKGSVVRNGQWTRGLVLLVPSVAEYEPMENDTVEQTDANGQVIKTWSVVGVKPIGPSGTAIGYEIDLGA